MPDGMHQPGPGLRVDRAEEPEAGVEVLETRTCVSITLTVAPKTRLDDLRFRTRGRRLGIAIMPRIDLAQPHLLRDEVEPIVWIVPLPADVDHDAARAVLQAGVLDISFPKLKPDNQTSTSRVTSPTRIAWSASP